jgi:hypothetical protein
MFWSVWLGALFRTIQYIYSFAYRTVHRRLYVVATSDPKDSTAFGGVKQWSTTTTTTAPNQR